MGAAYPSGTVGLARDSADCRRRLPVSAASSRARVASDIPTRSSRRLMIFELGDSSAVVSAALKTRERGHPSDCRATNGVEWAWR